MIFVQHHFLFNTLFFFHSPLEQFQVNSGEHYVGLVLTAVGAILVVSMTNMVHSLIFLIVSLNLASASKSKIKTNVDSTTDVLVKSAAKETQVATVANIDSKTFLPIPIPVDFTPEEISSEIAVEDVRDPIQPGSAGDPYALIRSSERLQIIFDDFDSFSNAFTKEGLFDEVSDETFESTAMVRFTFPQLPICPDGQSLQPNPVYQYLVNPSGIGGLINLVGNSLNILFNAFPIFKDCYIAHHKCYFTCHPKARDECDKGLRDCMKQKCNSTYNKWWQVPLKALCLAKANIIYLAVQKFGLPAFIAGQVQSCICLLISFTPGDCIPPQTLQQDPAYVIVTNGCSIQLGFIGTQISNIINALGAVFQSCCDAHSKAYQTCKYGRDLADSQFKDCMKNACAAKWTKWWQKQLKKHPQK